MLIRIDKMEGGDFVPIDARSISDINQLRSNLLHMNLDGLALESEIQIVEWLRWIADLLNGVCQEKMEFSIFLGEKFDARVVGPEEYELTFWNILSKRYAT